MPRVSSAAWAQSSRGCSAAERRPVASRRSQDQQAGRVEMSTPSLPARQAAPPCAAVAHEYAQQRFGPVARFRGGGPPGTTQGKAPATAASPPSLLGRQSLDLTVQRSRSGSVPTAFSFFPARTTTSSRATSISGQPVELVAHAQRQRGMVGTWCGTHALGMPAVQAIPLPDPRTCSAVSRRHPPRRLASRAIDYCSPGPVSSGREFINSRGRIVPDGKS
jgi:hypothetical protein